MTTFDPIAALARAKHTFGEHGGVNRSIEASTTFTVLSADTMPELFEGRRPIAGGGCYLYARHFNPTVYTLGQELAAIEGTDAAYCTASGMSAIAATLLQLCTSGDHVIASQAIYGGSHALLHGFLPQRAGIRATSVDVSDLTAVEAAFEKRTRLLFVESLSNPTLVVADLEALAKLAHARGVTLVVDNTFSPLVITPALHGADVVVHSLTKFVNGASDLIAGAICGSRDFITRLMDLRGGALMLLGPTLDPRSAFEISMRLPHLGLRIAEHGRRALELARRLDALGLPVTYPGLERHPQHALMTRLANPDFGYGGVLALDLGTRERAHAFMECLQNRHRFGFLAVSLGYADTLMSCSGSSTSSELEPEALAAAGISPGWVRMSIGYTGRLETRWEQLESALRSVGMLPEAHPPQGPSARK